MNYDYDIVKELGRKLKKEYDGWMWEKRSAELFLGTRRNHIAQKRIKYAQRQLRRIKREMEDLKKFKEKL